MLRPPHSPARRGRQNSIPSTQFRDVDPRSFQLKSREAAPNGPSNPGYKEES
jgi:hypothetical protein